MGCVSEGGMSVRAVLIPPVVLTTYGKKTFHKQVQRHKQLIMSEEMIYNYLRYMRFVFLRKSLVIAIIKRTNESKMVKKRLKWRPFAGLIVYSIS